MAMTEKTPNPIGSQAAALFRQWSDHHHGGAVAAAICASVTVAHPASAEQANNDPTKWAWTCKSSGFYIIKAFPNGSYQPAVDFTGNSQVIINIREASKDQEVLCGFPGYPKYFSYAEMQGPFLARMYSQGAPVCSEVKPSFEHSTLNKVAGSAREMSFIVSRDDNDWRFIISRTELTTEREGRELRILALQPGINYDAEADVWMITGQCIMTTNEGTPLSRVHRQEN